MKAAIYKQYGAPEVIQIMEVDKPVPNDHEILIQIKATAVNSGDVRLRKADPFAVRFFFGLTKPKVNTLGSVYAGVVETIGKNVTNYKKGDLVFGHTDMRFGAYAQYICVDESATLALKPATIKFSEAASIPFGALTALHFIQKADIQTNQKVLIIGASGAVGSAAVQLAKAFGAHVTGVCSTQNIELVSSLGADNVIDYTKEDSTKIDEQFDVIMDTINTWTVAKMAQSLKPSGTMILSAAGMQEMLQAFWVGKSKGIKVITGVTKHDASKLSFLKGLIEQGKFKPVIDRIYPLDQMVQAHTYVEKGHKRGNVVIEM